MFEKHRKYLLFYLLCLLLIFDVSIFYFDWKNSHKYFTFAMLDIGQGDALFIESPTGTQILVDGGPPKKILSALSSVMPAFDKSIDALIITNPDQDHIAGFSEVLDTYEVGRVFEPGTKNDTKTFENLKNKVADKNIPFELLRKGQRLNMGGEVYLDILFPDRDVSSLATNDGSVVGRLSFGDLSIMLTGDAPVKTEKIILSENSIDDLQSEILKVGHHGSRTSTSTAFLEVLAPEYALISAGENNKYGHPHPEIIETLQLSGLNVFRTDLMGTIILKSDGKTAKFHFVK